MGCRYVAVPRDLNFDKYLSIKEHMGIDIDIRDVKGSLDLLKYQGGFERYECHDRRTFDFLFTLMEELDLHLFDDVDHFEGSDRDSINDIGLFMVKHKKLVQRILNEGD